MGKKKQILVKAITRAEYETLPAVVRYFSPPFDVLAVDHYEPQPEQSHRKPHNERKKPSRPKHSQPQPRPAAQSVTG